MENNKIEMVEVEAKPITVPLEHPNGGAPKTEVEALRDIIKQKNETIEAQTNYIAELQEEVSKLRYKVKLLTL